MCPSNGDAAAMQAFITEHTDAVEAALDGGSLPEGVLTCNANLATCTGDLATCNSDLSTCEAIPKGLLLKTGETTAYGTGSDGDLQRGASQSFTDNGDGTITDNTTGLIWEKKDSLDNTPNPSDPHDADNTYTWSGASYGSTNIMDGTITTVFLAALNAGSGFAGHTDWRIPNRRELESLADLGLQLPAIDPVFNSGCAPGCTVTTCSCTSVALHYWSSSTSTYHPVTAWLVYFVDGDVNSFDKDTTYLARAVRGGS
jgi:hypothetical protein